MLPKPTPPQPPPPVKIIFGVFGFVFAAVGLTLLAFLWGALDDSPMSTPPLIFRLVGSFISIAFIAMGVGIITSFLRSTPQVSFPTADKPSAATPRTSSARYACPHCGAPLTDTPDVSPLGDVKCPFCASWFNIHHKHP